MSDIVTPGGLDPILAVSDDAEFEVHEDGAVENNKMTKGSIKSDFGIDDNTSAAENNSDRITALEGNTNESFDKILFNPALPVEPGHTPGQMYYDPITRGMKSDIGYDSVSVNLGREEHIEVYNDTGVLIENGDPVSVSGVITAGIPNIIPASSSSILSVLAFAGVATMDIPNGEKGIVTRFGLVNGVDTSGLSLGFIYLDPSGGYTQVRPKYPEERLIAGGVLVVDAIDGVISVGPINILRRNASRSYSFSSSDILVGQYYKAGFYDWSLTSVALTQASLVALYGTAGEAYAAHFGVVPNGPGVVDTGQVGLRVVGIQDMESGPQMAAQTGIITEDITTLTADTMIETEEKFSGQVSLELYVVSGAPVNFSLTCNYGFSKYEDFANQDATITTFECVWLSRKTDTNMDIELLHHKASGWTYAAAAFLPGASPIVQKTVDQQLAGNVVEGMNGAYKRTEINQFVDSNGPEGVLIRITTVDNKDAIQVMDLHIAAFSEEL